MPIIPKLGVETQIPVGDVLENFIFSTIALKYVQKIEKPGPPTASITTVYLYVK